MPLADSEWTLIRCLVLDHLVGTDNPYSFLRTHFPDEVAGWSITNVAAHNADMILANATSASLRDPKPFSITLLDVLSRLQSVQVKPDIVKVNEYLARLRGEMADLKLDDPFSVTVLTGTGQVFINREKVRESLRSMVKVSTRPEPIALTVRGEQNTGMSYTFNLIQHLAEPGSFRPARVILAGDSTAEDVLREFAVQIAPDSWPETVADPVKRLRYWALWLVQRGRTPPGRPWWFILDEWDRVDPNSDAVEFVLQLAQAIAELAPSPDERRPRLALLGYREDLPDLPLPIKQIRPDDAKPADESEVRAFFARHFREIQQHLDTPASDAEIDAMARQAAQQATATAATLVEKSGICYMRALSQAAEGAIDVFSSRPNGGRVPEAAR